MGERWCWTTSLQHMDLGFNYVAFNWSICTSTLIPRLSPAPFSWPHTYVTFSGCFKGHICGQENGAGDGLGTRLTYQYNWWCSPVYLFLFSSTHLYNDCIISLRTFPSEFVLITIVTIAVWVTFSLVPRPCCTAHNERLGYIILLICSSLHRHFSCP